MTTRPLVPVARRRFLVRLSAAAAGMTALLSRPAALASASVLPRATADGDPDGWIDRLTGENRVMIHAHQHFMTALVDARTMLANARDGYGIPEAEYSIAVITHGQAIQGLLRDEIWRRFALGELYKVNEPGTGTPATRNIYLQPQAGEPADAVVPDLMRRGVTFVACNVAVKSLAKKLAPAGANPDQIREELAEGLVPGTVLVPDVFVAVQRAQKRGIAYIFTDRSR